MTSWRKGQHHGCCGLHARDGRKATLIKLRPCFRRALFGSCRIVCWRAAGCALHWHLKAIASTSNAKLAAAGIGLKSAALTVSDETAPTVRTTAVSVSIASAKVRSGRERTVEDDNQGPLKA